MVEVEIRTPTYDEEAGQITWLRRALVRAEGADLVVYKHGEGVVLPDDLVVLDVATGAQVRRTDDPEVWARNLPHAYRNGDLVAVVLVDTDPPAADALQSGGATAPTIPTPPELAGMALSV